MTRKELSAVIAECAARTERAAAWQREAVAKAEAERAKAEAERAKYERAAEAARARQERAVAKQEEAVAKQEEVAVKHEEAVARHETTTAKQDKTLDEMKAMNERGEKMLQDYVRRTDEIIAEGRAWTKQITAELNDQRDERRALMEALLQLMDRLPPPPPHLRSA